MCVLISIYVAVRITLYTYYVYLCVHMCTLVYLRCALWKLTVLAGGSKLSVRMSTI